MRPIALTNRRECLAYAIAQAIKTATVYLWGPVIVPPLFLALRGLMGGVPEMAGPLPADGGAEPFRSPHRVRAP